MLKSVPVDGANLVTLDRGAGPPLVLVHGFPLSHKMWDEQIGVLADRFRVIAPDLRGFGASDVTRGTVTMEQFAKDLDELLIALGVHESVVLCGLSMGGYISFAFWRMYAPKVAALILCDTRSAPDTPEAAATRLKTADDVLERGTDSLAETMSEKLFSAHTRATQPDRVAAIRDVIRETSPEGIAAALRGMAVRSDSTPLLNAINVPTLMIVGHDDVITPAAEMKAMDAALPGSQFVEIPQAGHMAPYEQPENVNRIILEFLSGIELPRRRR